MNDHSVKVRVVMIDGTSVEFRSTSTYSDSFDGRVMYWEDVIINSGHVDYYSIPVYQIKEVFETED